MARILAVVLVLFAGSLFGVTNSFVRVKSVKPSDDGSVRLGLVIEEPVLIQVEHSMDLDHWQEYQVVIRYPNEIGEEPMMGSIAWGLPSGYHELVTPPLSPASQRFFRLDVRESGPWEIAPPPEEDEELIIEPIIHESKEEIEERPGEEGPGIPFPYWDRTGLIPDVQAPQTQEALN